MVLADVVIFGRSLLTIATVHSLFTMGNFYVNGLVCCGLMYPHCGRALPAAHVLLWEHHIVCCVGL